jgi:hypothetical protein
MEFDIGAFATINVTFQKSRQWHAIYDDFSSHFHLEEIT